VMGEHLLMASNKYGCDGLKLVCELALCETLTVENVAARLVLGEQAEADQLKEDALDYIAPRAAEVMASKGWQDVIAYGGATLVSEVLALLAGAPSVGSGGGGGGQDFSPSQDGPTPVPVRKRSADEAGLAPYTSQRRLSLSNGGANAVGSGAGAGAGAIVEVEVGVGGVEGGSASVPCAYSAGIRCIQGMRVAKLRRELGRRGLSALGRRGRLVERLEIAIFDEEKQATIKAAAAERERLERESLERQLIREAHQAESDM